MNNEYTTTREDDQNTLFKFVSILKQDLNEGKINQKQFELLLGFLFSIELEQFISAVERFDPDSTFDSDVSYR